MQDDRMDSYWEIGALLAKYPDLSPEEQAVFDAWLKQEGHEALWKEIKDPAYMQQRLAEWATLEDKKQLIRARLHEQIGAPVPFRKRRLMWGWYAAAASVILVWAAGYLWLNQPGKKDTASTTTQTSEPAVAPGTFKARLTLADGRIVYLDSAALGNLATQGHTRVENTGGQLVYDGDKANGTNKVLYNTLTTGRGESYAVQLADGSQVWLNAESSVTYPVIFNGNERKVQVTGEAYFDVEKSAGKPFIVQVGHAEVKVLGTEFNINAYPEENDIITTLVKGKVQLTRGTKIQTLTPGQQATLPADGGIILDPEADIEKATGWKKGLFVFKGDNIQVIMNQIARWYDVQIEYRGAVSTERFYGMMSRDKPLKTLLEVLEKNNIHFKIQGRTIIVTP